MLLKKKPIQKVPENKWNLFINLGVGIKVLKFVFENKVYLFILQLQLVFIWNKHQKIVEI